MKSVELQSIELPFMGGNCKIFKKNAQIKDQHYLSLKSKMDLVSVVSPQPIGKIPYFLVHQAPIVVLSFSI